MTETSGVDLSYIAPNLRQHAVPIDEPELHPDNARIGDVEQIKVSIKRFGQVRPIMRQESTGYIVAGNHTRKAMAELGLSHIAAIAVPMDDEEALAYLIADNRLAELGGYDDVGLNTGLEKLMLAGKLEGTGWSPDQVDDRLAAMDALPEVEPAPTEAEHGITDEGLNERYKNRKLDGPLRQFVVLYTQEIGLEVEAMLTRLARAWGVNGARDVVLEALRRAVAKPPVEGLSAEETARADAPPDDAPVTPEPVADAPVATPTMPDPQHSDPVPTPVPETPPPLDEGARHDEGHPDSPGVMAPDPTPSSGPIAGEPDVPLQPEPPTPPQSTSDGYSYAPCFCDNPGSPPFAPDCPRHAKNTTAQLSTQHPASGNLTPEEMAESGYDGPMLDAPEPGEPA